MMNGAFIDDTGGTKSKGMRVRVIEYGRRNREE